MNSHKTINLDYLRKLARGDEKFVEDVIELFIKNTPNAIRNMRKYYERENWEDLMMEAHKIRPSFNFMGTREMEEAAKAIENYASRQTELEKIESFIEKIEKNIEEVYEELKDELRKINI